VRVDITCWQRADGTVDGRIIDVDLRYVDGELLNAAANARETA
jgi:hypothetical protein